MKKIIVIIGLLAMLTSCNNSDSKGHKKDELKEEKSLSKEKESKTEESAFSKGRISNEEAVKLAVKQFEAYLPKILKTYDDGGIDLQDPHVGDFTGDGIDDVAIYWNIAPQGGNALIGQGLSLYKNDGHTVKVIAGYEPDYLFAFDTIKNGKIIVEKLEYTEEDGRCCPSIKTKHALTIKGNKAY
ncbi:membrane lipoprotein lipid attachment site-containing protein [Chryseobacterium tructae]|uniref:Type IV secretion system putative lipoprotein virB7 n=1 Tax=Chryseobacterium tructae TaxID=1037380 RepID=A0ABV7XWM5_9FLAO|nr:membrane lipoprotein lipid attachment site-containing protein [Chryseobacterium tructae]MDN3691771.1 membrane lipoprotein lipid attachment site-containing protein [Chryseobacterium tructae]